MTLTKEFKEAISHLSSKEKDKLILRLLKKDVILAKRLYFELVDDRTVDDRRLDVGQSIKNRIERLSKYDYSPGYLMMDMRDISGKITQHVKVAKDKYGEISLTLLMLNEVLRFNNKSILATTPGKARKLCIYVISRVFKTLVLINKLHKDLQFDFYEALETLGELISKNDYLMKTAVQNGLDVNWLLQLEIPEDIEQIHKDIRSQGYLTSNVYIGMPKYHK